MNHSETLSLILTKDQSILHFSFEEERLDKYQEFKNYKTIGSSLDSDIKIYPDSDLSQELLSGYDLVLLSSYLEILEDPVKLIKQVKNLAETICIYEYKYELMNHVNPLWKKHWIKIGLTWNLQQNFDFINELYLEEATLHTCKIPYTQDENQKKVLENASQ